MTRKATRVQSSRSRNGCLTCRARHIKCDETGPVCKNCIKSNKVCKRGSKLNFFKTMVVKPIRPKENIKNYNIIRFLDQSLTIHNVYDENDYHDYSDWLKNHSQQELNESDSDFRNSMKMLINDVTKNNLTLVSVIELYDFSDSETSRQSPTPSIEQFDLSHLISKVLSYPPQDLSNLSLFAYSNQSSILKLSKDLDTQRVVDNELSVNEFASFVDYLENLENEYGINYKVFQNHFSLFLNSLIYSMKLERIDLFQESYSNTKIKDYIKHTLDIEQFQTFENLMNFFELLMLDLSDSLTFDKASVFSIYEERVEFLTQKFLNLNLCDDLNYFLIRVITILLRLNTLFHDSSSINNREDEISRTIKEMKDLENNQFLSIYFPKISQSSVSSNSSSGSFGPYNNTYNTSSKVEFPNVKVKRFHTYYTFTVCFLLKNFNLSNQQISVLHSNTLLKGFWESIEGDPFKRLEKQVFENEFNNDVFLSFLTKPII